MHTHLLAGGRFHSIQLAQTLLSLGQTLELYTSVPKNRFGELQYQLPIHFTPLMGTIANYFTGRRWGIDCQKEAIWFDKLAKLRIGKGQVLYSWAGYGLEAGISMQNRGGVYLLERSCPHINYQEKLLEQECGKLEINYQPKARYWIERCLEEYERADRIIVPSRYTASTFPKNLQKKIFQVPLDTIFTHPRQKSHTTEFTVGMVCGNVVRKGLLYLLKAWSNLSLPRAKLLLKIPKQELTRSPQILRLLKRTRNIQCIEYVKNMSEFYRQCDLYVLPAIDEGFGLTVREALNHSLPVILTDKVGAAECLTGDPFHTIVAARDVVSLQEQIEWHYQNPKMLLAKSQAAYQWALQAYHSPTLYKTKISYLYDTLASRYLQ